MASVPFHVKAVYEYSSEHDDDLSFAIGQIITVTEIEDDDWYVGEYVDPTAGKKDGLFPKNYVERYEPPAPPRPARPRPKKDPAPATEPEPAARAEPPPEPVSASVEEPPMASSQPEIERPVPVPPQPAEPPLASKPPPAKPAAAKPSAPEPAPKPTGNSFRDRIAAFNKPAAPPVAPKPSGASTSNFIKKPYVPPPPARDAYVPPPREPVQPQVAYRREEDPEIAERQAQALKDAEEAGLVGDEQGEEGEAPKATSLKDRIAMLQKQQQEQAARRAESASKEKAARPAKPRADSGEAADADDDDQALSKVTSPASAADLQTGLSNTSSARRSSQYSLEPPAREVPSDGNDADQSGAGDTTEDAGASSTEVDEADERPRRPGPPVIPSRTSTSGTRDPVAREIEHEEQQEEDEEIDEETRRKEELRARMAKMSGGMGMAGFFGGPMLPPAKRPSGSSDKRASSIEAQSPPPPPQRAPMVPMPGMGVPPKVQSPQPEDQRRVSSTTSPDDTEVPIAGAPPIPQERPLPQPPSGPRPAPPVPTAERPVPGPPQARAAPPPPPERQPSTYDAEDSLDEPTPLAEEGPTSRAVPPLPPVSTELPTRPGPQSPRQAPPIPPSASSGPMSPGEKRASRPPPPVPGAMSPASTGPSHETRPPPPPPPAGAPPSRSSTMKDSAAARPSADGESDYEGDYDTDIASAVPHKDALKAHEREPSIDEGTLSEDAPISSRPTVPPPVPPSQRAAPPPPPHQPPARKSTDISRAPPPAPPARSATGGADDDYDPYRYEPTRTTSSKKTRVTSDVVQESDPSLYAVSPDEAPRRNVPPPTMPPGQKHAVPPPLPPDHTDPPMPPSLEARQSVDIARRSSDRRSVDRRSMDPGGRPADGSMIARDVDLAESTQWWTGANMPPPVFQNRPDVLFEMEETTTSKRGGRSTISKDVYVLFQDYSQTVVTARFDPKDPSNNVFLEQRHEPPPSRLRQDQLETAHAQYGQAVAAAATQKLNSTLGDGSPQALILDLINTSAPNALKPIGTRAYGSLVYANMANASVQQLDEIRPGDIVSFRNARFQGKHGAMHAKYSLDVGKPEHVAVVMEWDGTKKKIRAWEQGREKERKVKVESFKVGDLRSGEVKVWRLVGRDFVGWEANA